MMPVTAHAVPTSTDGAAGGAGWRHHQPAARSKQVGIDLALTPAKGLRTVQIAARAMDKAMAKSIQSDEAADIWQADWHSGILGTQVRFWRVSDSELNCAYQTSAMPTPAAPLSEPLQPRRCLSVPKPSSAPLPSPPEPEKAISSSSPGAEEPPSAQIQPSQPSPAITTTPSLPPPPPSADQAPAATNGPNRARSCSKARHRRAHRRPLGSTRRGQTRRARRAVDPAVQERAAAFASARAAPVCGASTGGNSASAKRIYTREQLLSLRPQGPSLHAAAPCFVPQASRYSCYARAVHLGFADRMPPRPLAFRSVPTAAAQEMLVRVHAATIPPTAGQG